MQSYLPLLLFCALAMTPLSCQSAPSRLRSEDPEWDVALNAVPKFKALLETEANKRGHQIVLTDITHYPSREYLAKDVLGTLKHADSQVHIYLNRSWLTNNPALFANVVSHEYLHFVMDQEGYPITKRTPQYSDDPMTAQLGTCIQDAVLHYEVFRRQALYSIDTSSFPSPCNILIPNLLSLGVNLNAPTERSIHDLLSITNGVSREHAFHCIAQIVKLVDLSDRLYVGPVEPQQRMSTANKASDATSEPAPGAASSSHQR